MKLLNQNGVAGLEKVNRALAQHQGGAVIIDGLKLTVIVGDAKILDISPH